MSPLPTEPTSVNAGDTVSWTKSLADYPASAGWQLTYTLINATHKITVDATASGADHLVQVTAATSAEWNAGTYAWQSRVSKAAEVYTVDSGNITVNPSFASQTTFDNRSHAVKTLEAIESTIEGRASSAVAEYEIAGRKLKYINPVELLKLRDFYRGIVRQEQAAERISKGLSDPRKIFVRFGS
ncbi:hypothetical protein [Undibacterium macrobrachii]|uniref:Uncharacterized protein n=1 Tax=Undibacterium macrobrachii TaxID=1119058 RepID=A0ABQ2X681_9BURK|nr:hypothetical protein [Undibacterium macrobrachii]GGX01468.1 hypothetical protein GCM10011282_04250 [Undibacterium macrobrachii]